MSDELVVVVLFFCFIARLSYLHGFDNGQLSSRSNASGAVGESR